MNDLLMTAKLLSRSVCFEPISKSALYQGTTSVVPKRASRTRALAPAALFPSQFGFGQRPAAQPAGRTLPLQHSIVVSNTIRCSLDAPIRISMQPSDQCAKRGGLENNTLRPIR